jgi:hypothetical protein
MKLLKVPVRYWPLEHHIWLAIAVGSGLLAAVLTCLQMLENHVEATRKDLQQLQIHQLEARKTPPPTATEQFEKTLPSAQVAEAVARDITAFAVTANVQVSSVQIENSAGSPSEYATVLYQVNAKGEYRQTKQWIAELLGRYETLAIKSLSIQALANETARQDIRMTLVLYVRG